MYVKYVLMFVDTEAFTKELEAMTPTELERAYQRVSQWLDDHAAKITNRGAKLRQ